MRAWVVAVLLVAGCAGSDGDENVMEAGPVDGPVRLAGDPVASGAAPPGNVTDWRSFELHAEGDAGAWLVAYQPFPAPREELGISITYRLVADGEEPIVFAVPPGLVHGKGEDAALRVAPIFGGDNMMRGTGRVEYVYERSYSSYSTLGMAGVFFAAAANAPWALEVRVDVDDGGSVAPVQHLVTGDGAKFAWGTDRALPAGGADILRHAATHEAPGWSHIEVFRDPLQPIGVRQQDFRLPGGASYLGLGTMTGYDTYVLMASASSGGYAEVFGDLGDAPGERVADLTLVEADLDVDMASVHVPIVDVPPGLGAGVYAGAKWPFRDDLPGTSVAPAATAVEMESLIR